MATAPDPVRLLQPPSLPPGRRSGRFSRALDWWGRHQRWWWVGIVMLSLGWFGFDMGQMVTRASLVSLGGPAAGSLSLAEVEKKAEDLGGGRLIITSANSARFIDRTGAAWEIPGFGDELSRDHWRRLADRHVLVDGDVTIGITPVKTTPRDLVLTSLTDFFIRMGVLGLYGGMAWFVLRSIRRPSRYNRVEGSARPATRIASVAGHEGPKREVLEIVDYLRHPETFIRVGARPPNGVLLYGPPGTGKTLLAKAIAGEADAHFIEQSASSFVQIYAGEGARAVRSLFAEARKQRPCVVFIDEIDAIGQSRSAPGAHDERAQTLNALLTEMDGFADNTGIVVVAATNRIEVLDEALVRPGRFDRKVHVPLPSRLDRRAILAVHAANLPQVTADLDLWADQTSGFSGADLASLVNEAAIEAARANLGSVGDKEFSAARERVLLGARNLGQVLSAADRRTVAIHELGHALVRLREGGAVEKVSIMPRTRSLGVTLTKIEEEELLQTPDRLRRELTVLMGGRAAEEVLLGQVTSGSADDIDRASRLAREGVRRYGWKQDVPYVPEHESLVRETESKAAVWVGEAYAAARAFVEESREALVRAGVRLAEAEELSGAELSELLDLKDGKPRLLPAA